MSFFEQKVNSSIKIRERGQSSNHNFRIHEIWTRKTDFSQFTQKKLQIHDGTENRLNAL